MNENRHNRSSSHSIDDLFRSAIEPLEEPPSTKVWENVEKDLDRYNIINIKKKYNNLKTVAIALVLILSSALMYEFQIQQNTLKRQHAAVKTINNSQTGNSYVENESSSNEDAKAAAKSHLQHSTPYQPFIAAIDTENAIAVQKNTLPLIASQRFKNFLSQIPSTAANQKNDLQFFGPSYHKVDQSSSVLPEKNISNDRYLSASGKKDVELSSTSLRSFDMLRHDNVVVSQHNNFISFLKCNQFLAVRNSAGEDNSNDPAKPSGKLSKTASSFSISLIFSPDFTSRLVKEDWPVNREDNRDEIRKSERYAFSYSFGAIGDYAINKHWGIQSGFTLSRAVINIDPKFIFARPDDVGDVKYKFNSSSGYSYLSPHSMSRPAFGDSLHAFGSSSSLLYVSVPVAAKYKIAGRKIDFYASAGIAANILVKGKIETSLVNGGNHENAVNHDIRGLKPVYYSALLAAGASYNFNRTFAVSFTPTARMALTSINKDAPVKSYQQSLGLVAGMQINL